MEQETKQNRQTEVMAPVDAILKNARYEPSVLLALAISKDIGIEGIERLMELQVKYDALQAKKSYTKAITAFKKNPPEILQDKTVSYENRDKSITSYKHVSLGKLVEVLTPALSEYDISVGWKTEQANGHIKVTCNVTHIDGHTESSWLEAGPDGSGGKNSIQAVGSTVKYLKRYTLKSIIGIEDKEDYDDDDGKAAGDASKNAILNELNEKKWQRYIDNHGMEKAVNAVFDKFASIYIDEDTVMAKWKIRNSNAIDFKLLMEMVKDFQELSDGVDPVSLGYISVDTEHEAKIQAILEWKEASELERSGRTMELLKELGLDSKIVIKELGFKQGQSYKTIDNLTIDQQAELIVYLLNKKDSTNEQN